MYINITINDCNSGKYIMPIHCNGIESLNCALMQILNNIGYKPAVRGDTTIINLYNCLSLKAPRRPRDGVTNIKLRNGNDDWFVAYYYISRGAIIIVPDDRNVEKRRFPVYINERYNRHIEVPTYQCKRLMDEALSTELNSYYDIFMTYGGQWKRVTNKDVWESKPCNVTTRLNAIYINEIEGL